MFIRKHPKEGFNYYSLVESYRDAGKADPSQLQVEWLGDYDQARVVLAESREISDEERARLLLRLAEMAAPTEAGRRERAAAVRLATKKARLIAEAAKLGLEVIEPGANAKRKRNPHGSPSSDPEWYTPPFIIEKAREVLGGIDLDPASNATAQQWIRATHYFTKDDDGLRQSWFISGVGGAITVWCNPPYGNMAQKFLAKAISSFEAGEISAAILLLGAGRSKWRRELLPKCSAICRLSNRLSFIDASGQPICGNSKDSDLVLVGVDEQIINRFAAVFGVLGEIETAAGLQD